MGGSGFPSSQNTWWMIMNEWYQPGIYVVQNLTWAWYPSPYTWEYQRTRCQRVDSALLLATFLTDAATTYSLLPIFSQAPLITSTLRNHWPMGLCVPLPKFIWFSPTVPPPLSPKRKASFARPVVHLCCEQRTHCVCSSVVLLWINATLEIILWWLSTLGLSYYHSKLIEKAN